MMLNTNRVVAFEGRSVAVETKVYAYPFSDVHIAYNDGETSGERTVKVGYNGGLLRYRCKLDMPKWVVDTLNNEFGLTKWK